jgi:hypothetical protein
VKGPERSTDDNREGGSGSGLRDCVGDRVPRICWYQDSPWKPGDACVLWRRAVGGQGVFFKQCS